MNWLLLLISFSLAVFMGSAAVSLFTIWRPAWSQRRIFLASAGLLPAITLLVSAGLIVAVLAGGASARGGDMRDLAVAAIIQLGALIAILALFGGVVGASLRQRGMRR